MAANATAEQGCHPPSEAAIVPPSLLTAVTSCCLSGQSGCSHTTGYVSSLRATSSRPTPSRMSMVWEQGVKARGIRLARAGTGVSLHGVEGSVWVVYSAVRTALFCLQTKDVKNETNASRCTESNTHHICCDGTVWVLTNNRSCCKILSCTS